VRALALLFGCIGFCVSLMFWDDAVSSTDVYVDQVDPMAFSVDGVEQGLLYDLLTELSHRVNHVGPVIPVPLKRVRFLLKIRDDTLGTLWRFPEIDSEYHWWCKLLDSTFVMTAAPGSPVDLSSAEHVRNLRVGVILGSPAELLLHRLHFEHVQTTTTAESNAQKLMMGRIDVWVASPRVIRAVQARMGGKVRSLRISEPIATYGVYLASSPRFDVSEGEKWKSAFETMERDGTAARIRKKYESAAHRD